MQKRVAIEHIKEWLSSCVSCAEADGYQEHESEPWCGDEGAPELYTTAKGFVVTYMGRTFEMQLRQFRKDEKGLIHKEL